MKLRNLIIIICGLAGFTVVAYNVKTRGVLSVDSLITGVIYPLRGDAINNLFSIITLAGNWQTITFICLAALIIKRTRRFYGCPLALSASVSAILNHCLKNFIERARPDEALRLISAGGFSYPSGHSMTGLVVYALIIYFVNTDMKNKTAAKIITVILSALILLIGFSRILLGVHYPTDVPGGFCMGTAIVFGAITLNNYMRAIDFYSPRE